MKTDVEIREAQERTMSVFRRRPETAMDTVAAVATVSSGLTCEFKQGEQSATMDMPMAVGGNDQGPTPGFFARAAISGCVAIGIKMAAARLDIDLKSVEVHVEMDFDNSAVFGMGQSTAAPLVTRLSIALESEANLDVLEGLVATALKSDPYFLALRDAQTVETDIRLK